MKDFKNRFNGSNFIKNMKKSGKQPNVRQTRKSHIPFRLNFLFFVIFALFVALIVQLGYLQISNGASFQQKIEQSSKRYVKGSTPRGTIYDASGKEIVSNEAKPAITYTRGAAVTAEDMLDVATKLSKLIDIEPDDLKERDKKDFWLANPKNFKKADDRLKDSEKAEAGNNESALYALRVDKVTDGEIKFDKDQMKIATIYTRMNAAQEFTTVFIKNDDVSNDEIAVIGEHTAELPGVSTGADWVRKYPDNVTLKSILGRVSSEKTGLPQESAEEYLAKGYAMNDRVGTSYLEQSYESVLQGTKSQSEVILNSKGDIVSQKQVYAGEKGQNLMLTIDEKFQEKMEKAVKDIYQDIVDKGVAKYSPGVYAVAMNPKTGEVLGMTGFLHNIETGELDDHAIGTFQSSFAPGSVVKGGTLTAGWQAGVISDNQTLNDQAIKIAGSEIKASWFNRTLGNQIPITAIQALQYSSNSYMMQVALKMLGIESITKDMSIRIPEDGPAPYFQKLRDAFAEYGMGTITGLDLPGEETGLVSQNYDSESIMGNFLDLSFGQYDTYTAMQLAQYVSTIANGGKRIAPHVVKGIYANDENGNLGTLQKAVEPKVLNTVDVTPDQMKIIHEGFYQVVHGEPGYTTGRVMANAKMDLAGKTGTAETSVTLDNKEVVNTINSNVVAYGPADDPEIAVAVMLPNLTTDEGSYNQLMVNGIMDAYYDMYIKN